MKKFMMVVAITLLVGVSSCEKEEGFTDTENGGVLLLELRLPIDAGANSGVVVHARTTNHFGCLGYSIDTEWSKNEDAIHIHYGEIIEPTNPCAAALGPATGNVNLQNLTYRIHPFTVQYLGETVSGELQVNATHYKLELEENDVVRVVIDEVAR